MRDFKSRRYWLIGASEGLGAALAHELSAAGADLILSARNEEALHALAESLPGQAEVVPIDVRDMASVERAAQVCRVTGWFGLFGGRVLALCGASVACRADHCDV
jgi:NADP-dependent 3-hydroxy acid dehydrogenase YdfG